MSERTYLDYLDDIRDSLRKAQAFVAGMTFDEFALDEKTNFAVVRALEIVGEATKRIPAEVKGRSPNLPWRDMAGMRDKLAHDYSGVNLEVVWETATKEAPALEAEIRTLISQET
jgi:uncharacterized protein with HEPN domain